MVSFAAQYFLPISQADREMRIILLNWSAGENDPFTYFNEQFQRQLIALGHEVYIVPLNALISETMHEICAAVRIDLVFTWQGLGSAVGDVSIGKTLWAQLGIPLVCLHGDHPCYNPTSHQQTSQHVFHVYLVEAFAQDANRLIRRDWPALFEALPNFFQPSDAHQTFEGDYFVLPKNLNPLAETRRGWKEQRPDATYQLLCACAEAIEQEYRSGNRRNHLEVILDTLPSSISGPIRAGHADASNVDFVFALARELDQVHRNFASEFVIESLPDIPIHVYGRGWDHFAARGNPHHRFHPFDRVEHGDAQFRSAFGIIDVASHNGSLHDRTLRAMRQGGGFLLSSAWRRHEPIHTEFSDLFFSGAPNDLRAKVDEVRHNPARHRARVREFTDVFDAHFSMAAFTDRIRCHLMDRALGPAS
jgi:hypothetical protein